MPDVAAILDKVLPFVPERWRGLLAILVCLAVAFAVIAVGIRTLQQPSGNNGRRNEQGADTAPLADKAVDESARSHRWAEDQAEALIDNYRRTEHDLRGQVAQLTEEKQALVRAVESLAAKRDDPAAPPGVEEALACLKEGDTAKAEAVFANIAACKGQEGGEALVEAAHAYRHLGALAFLHNTEKALASYRKATELDPADPDGWNMLGLLLRRSGELAGAEVAFARVRDIGERTGYMPAVAAATGNLGLIFMTRGELAQAEAMFRKALSVEQALGRKVGMACQYANIGLINMTRGDLDQAEHALRRSLDLHEASGSKQGVAEEHTNLGVVHGMRGDLGRAETAFRRSLDLYKELDHKEGTASNYGNLGLVYNSRGDLDQAEEMLWKSLALNKELGHKEGIANQYANLGTVHMKRGELDRASEMHCKALVLNEELGHKEHMAINHTNLGILYASRGDTLSARDHYKLALALYQKIGAHAQAQHARANIAALGG